MKVNRYITSTIYIKTHLLHPHVYYNTACNHTGCGSKDPEAKPVKFFKKK